MDKTDLVKSLEQLRSSLVTAYENEDKVEKIRSRKIFQKTLLQLMRQGFREDKMKGMYAGFQVYFYQRKRLKTEIASHVEKKKVLYERFREVEEKLAELRNDPEIRGFLSARDIGII